MSTEQNNYNSMTPEVTAIADRVSGGAIIREHHASLAVLHATYTKWKTTGEYQDAVNLSLRIGVHLMITNKLFSYVNKVLVNAPAMKNIICPIAEDSKKLCTEYMDEVLRAMPHTPPDPRYSKRMSEG